MHVFYKIIVYSCSVDLKILNYIKEIVKTNQHPDIKFEDALNSIVTLQKQLATHNALILQKNDGNKHQKCSSNMLFVN